jgi:hypothetical protein
MSQVIALGGEHFQRLAAAGGHIDAVAETLEQHLQNLAHPQFVFDHQDAAGTGMVGRIRHCLLIPRNEFHGKTEILVPYS